MSVAQPNLPGSGTTLRILRDDGVTFVGITVPSEMLWPGPVGAKLAQSPGLSAAEQARARSVSFTSTRQPREPSMEGPGWAIYSFPGTQQLYVLRDDGTHLSWGAGPGVFTPVRAAGVISATPGLSATEIARLSSILGGAVASGGTPTPVPVLLSSFDASGWSAQWADGTPPTFAPDASPITVDVVRQGFSATAGSGNRVVPTSFTESRIILTRLRQAAPQDALFTPKTVVLDSPVYTTDVAYGVLPGQIAAPVPVCKNRWAQRKLIDSATNQCQVEISADHADGIAAAVVTLSDGVNPPLVQTIVNPVPSNRLGDVGAVLVYRHTFDTSSLNAGVITENWEVYPRVGNSASVARSADLAAETRGFCPLVRVKGPAYYVYVDSVLGNDTTAVVSTDATAAAAAPALTENGAAVKARAVMPANRTSGLFARHRAGTWALQDIAFNVYQDATSAEVVYTRDPTVPASQVNFTYSAAVALRFLYFAFDDVGTVTRGANVSLAGSGNSFRFRNLTIDLGNFAANLLAVPSFYLEGNLTLLNVAAGALQHGTGKCYMMRGITAGVLAGPTIGCDAWDLAGSELRNANVVNVAAESGTFIEGTIVRTTSSGGSGGVSVATQAGTTCTGLVLRNLVIEYNGPGGPTPATGLRISADATGADTVHSVLRGVTLAGQGAAGRANLYYNESAGTTRRSHTHIRMEGCYFGQLNTKGDRFVFYSQGNSDSVNRTGNWWFDNGVGCRGNVIRGPNADNGSNIFGQQYPGLATLFGTAAAPIDLQFTDYKAVTFAGGVYTAGTGGGTYSISAGSPAKGVLTNSRNKFDFIGAARPSPDTAGAYA